MSSVIKTAVERTDRARSRGLNYEGSILKKAVQTDFVTTDNIELQTEQNAVTRSVILSGAGTSCGFCIR